MTGTLFNAAEIQQARDGARKFPWIESAAALRKRAEEIRSAGRADEARPLYRSLAALPLAAEPVAEAKKRASE